MIKKIDNLGYKSGKFAPFVEYPQHVSYLHNMSIDVGAKLRSVRVAFGLSQRALARRAGVTNGLISLIEQNRVSPSVSSLKKVLDGVPMSMAEFFTLDEASAPQMFFGAEELVEVGTEAISQRLVAAQRSGRQLSILHERYAAGAAVGDEMLAHRGEEGGVVIRGRIELTIGGATRLLGPGDAYYFASQLPHRFRNVGREVCEVVSCVTPPRQYPDTVR
jgi:transcriptional regulator with XRE-family HTH domain